MSWRQAAVRIVTVLLTLLVPATLVSPVQAAQEPTCHTTLPQTLTLRPVVLVHGWNSSIANEESLGKAVEGQARGRYWMYCFDYSALSSHWPLDENIHQALANDIVGLSRAYLRGGGDGKVLAAAHSMGGIALRFAANDAVGSIEVGDVLAGVVTLGTPHQGSPWGGTKLGRDLEAAVQYLRTTAALPPSDADASACLAVLTRRNSSCGDVPYLPAGVPITELGTQIYVTRSLFNVPFVKGASASVPLFGDGIVPRESSTGYLGSGPHVSGTRKLAYPAEVSIDTTDCHYDSDYLLAARTGAKIGGGGIGSLIGGLVGVFANEQLDLAALDLLARDEAGLALAQLSSYAYQTDCFHTRLTTQPDLVGATVAAFAKYAKNASAGPEALTVTDAAVPDIGLPNYDTSGSYPQVGPPTQSHRTPVDLSVVNAALEATVSADQQAYRRNYDTNYASQDAPTDYRGVYQTDMDASLVVANSDLISTMYPSLELFPGGNDGSGWMTTNVLVPSGQPISLRMLFRTTQKGLDALSRATMAEVARAQTCQPSAGLEEQFYREGLAPTPENYQHFALTPDSLDVGLEQGQIGIEACSTIRVSIPWQSLRGVLSPTGWRLAGLAGRGLSVAPCSAARLYKAAAKAEGLDPHDPGYRSVGGPGVEFAHCHHGWAIALVRRPNVGTTDGGIVFRAAGTHWREIGAYGFTASECPLTSLGMPADIAKQFNPVNSDGTC